MDEDEIPLSGRTTERLISLSDGVFAFALTLLALTINIPSGFSAKAYYAFLIRLVPKLVSYMISVLIIGVTWMAHQRMFRFIKCYNHEMLWLNLLFLTSITLVPPATLLLREYPYMRSSVIIYAIILGAGSLLLFATWRYTTSRPELVTKDLDAEIIQYYGIRGLTYLASDILTIIIALFNPIVAQFTLLALFITIPFFDRLHRPPRA